MKQLIKVLLISILTLLSGFDTHAQTDVLFSPTDRAGTDWFANSSDYTFFFKKVYTASLEAKDEKMVSLLNDGILINTRYTSDSNVYFYSFITFSDPDEVINKYRELQIEETEIYQDHKREVQLYIGKNVALSEGQRSFLSSLVKDGSTKIPRNRWNEVGERSLFIDKNESESGTFAIYPNPVSDRLTIKTMEGTYLVVLLDYSGKILLYQEIDPEHSKVTMDLTQQKPGIYIVKVHTDSGAQSHKVIKK